MPSPYIHAYRGASAASRRAGTSTVSRALHSSAASATAAAKTSGGRGNGSVKYPFPSIPRPRRNPFYYYNPVAQFKRGIHNFRSSPKNFVVRRTGFRYLPAIKNGRPREFARTFYSRRFSSSYSQQSSSARKDRRFLRWWTVPAVSLILWGVLRRKRQSQQEEELDAFHSKPAKPWQVAAYSTLPLKAMSRLWGRFNDITLPVWMREPGFKLYSYMFGVNLDEVAEQDLTKYANLGEFFYRELKPGVRPVDESCPLVSPADGTVLHMGVINDKKVEQVKGITYSLDALLGSTRSSSAPHHVVDFDTHNPDEVLERHKEFAVMNGISYTLDDLIGGSDGHPRGLESVDRPPQETEDAGDASYRRVSNTSVTTVSKDLMAPDFTPSSEKELFFTVVYLAPGDYHRFHSPANWVAETRRHFSGELYSVSPYFQTRLQNLFCLNERVALLGRWRYGFFSMTPVGATNVGSIKIHFDKYLRTNTYYEVDQPPASEENSSMESSTASLSSASSDTSSQKKKKVKKASCYEANYTKASRLLGGYPLSKGQQMGGFNLGSTVVLVFEAPKSFQFNVKPGQKVKVGQAIGGVPNS
jgi:phosphatidylserine decarboxylase